MKIKSFFPILGLLFICCLPSKCDSSMDDLLLWGTYKPYLFSAITQKSKHPVSIGFAYSEYLPNKVDEDIFKEKLRYRMRRDSTAQYSYHNGFDLAIQHIEDKDLCVNYDIYFLEDIDHTKKHFTWRYLIDAKQNPDCVLGSFKNPKYEKQHGVDFMEHFLYVALQNLDHGSPDERNLKLISQDRYRQVLSIDTKKSKEYIEIKTFDDTKGEQNPNIKEVFNCLSTLSNKTRSWEIENLIHEHLTEDPFNDIAYLDPWKCDNNARKEDSALFLSQLFSRPPFKILISYDSKDMPEAITLEKLHEKIEQKKKELESQIDKVFPFKNYNKYRIDPQEVKEIIRFGISNLLGGILYSYGKIKIEDKADNQVQRKELFTASPSRVGFPRGFLWDEGFHQQVICRWNSSLCVRMISTWIESIDEKGWIPREQARGDEIESNFKQKSYLTQTPREANPPSMMLPIEYLAMKVVNRETSREESQDIGMFLDKNRGKLKRWLRWFAAAHINNDPRDTGDVKDIVLFRWNCKMPCNGRYLASGLDDYPRHAPGYHPVANLDLHGWIFQFSHTVNMIGYFFNDTEPELVRFEQAIPRSFGYLIDQRTNRFMDIVAENKVDQDNRTIKYFSPSIGYVNLFPIFFGLVYSNMTFYEATLDIAAGWDHLWTDYGLRSLSKSDPFFMQGDQYWTEPIWIPMNYMMLRGLKRYYNDDKNGTDLYERLRENLILNMIKNWRETHNFWENYDSFTGKGKGFPSFTGWTTLIVLIMSEQY